MKNSYSIQAISASYTDEHKKQLHFLYCRTSIKSMYADILIITAFDGVFYTPLDIDVLNFSMLIRQPL
jgi:hypothetical protein